MDVNVNSTFLQAVLNKVNSINIVDNIIFVNISFSTFNWFQQCKLFNAPYLFLANYYWILSAKSVCSASYIYWVNHLSCSEKEYQKQ